LNIVSENPFGYFEKIYCINLDSRPERWKEAQAEFSKAGILARVERISGEVCSDPREGCARAHLKTIRLAKQLNLPNCLIFEDDVLILEDALPALHYSVRDVSRVDWDLFYLGATTVGPAYQISHHLAKLTGACSTQSYAISARIYDAVLHSWHPPKVYDVFLTQDIIPAHQCFITVPMVTEQKTGFSDIENRVVDYHKMMTRNFAHDLVRGADGKGGIWRLPEKRRFIDG
jgi:glycosyl transferase family 25